MSSPPSRVTSYGLAVSSVALALFVTLSLGHPELRGPIFIPAILVGAWYGGIGPGLLAVALSVLGSHFLLVPPRFVLRLVSLDDAVYLLVFTLSALFVAWLAGTRRRIEEALRQAHGELTDRMQDRERANERLQAEIAERERAERAVQKQASLLDLTHDSIIVRDVNDVITFWNRGAAERYGWSSEEAVGKVSHRLTQTIFPARLGEIEAELLRAGRWEGELVHTKRDGARVVVASRWSLQRDAGGRPAGVLETNNDITERKEAEYLTSQVFECSPDSVAVIGRDYRFQRVNPTVERRYGLPAEKIVGMHVADIIGVDFFEQAIKPRMDRCFAGQDVSFTTWMTNAVPGRRFYAVTYSPLQRDPERVEAVLATTRDLTEHLRAAEALQQAQAELARVTRVTMLGEITASIAHEVNQPLAAVVMNGNACRRWLAADPPNIDEAREAAQRIISDGERAGQVIGRIRALVRRATPEKSLLDVNGVIGESLALTRGELEREAVSVRTELREELPPVVGDRVQLQQVLMNLILNGVDAMAGITAWPRALTVRSRRQGSDRVLVEVEDRGKGLGAGQLDRMFDAFFSTKPGGMGMGLSISRSIVEAHGGSIWATPNDGDGVTMRFTVPVGPGGA